MNMCTETNHLVSEAEIPPKIRKEQHVCYICGKVYKYESSLNVHIGIHNGVSPYECEYCGKQFTQKIGLIKHIPIHTQVPQYQCDICGKSFIHDKTYKNHMRNHLGQNNVHCSVCNLGFQNKKFLERHLRVHTKEKPFTCDVCGNCFSQKHNMYAHKRIVHRKGKETNVFQKECPLCGVSYQRNQLAEHLSEHHVRENSTIQYTEYIYLGIPETLAGQ